MSHGFFLTLLSWNHLQYRDPHQPTLGTQVQQHLHVL